ncbi:13310_t:CDS:1, partial [Dentiscutata erythropus]
MHIKELKLAIEEIDLSDNEIFRSYTYISMGTYEKAFASSNDSL